MAADKDVVLAFMGTSPLMEGEEGEALLAPANGDRSDIALPAVQVEFLKQLINSWSQGCACADGRQPYHPG